MTDQYLHEAFKFYNKLNDAEKDMLKSGSKIVTFNKGSFIEANSSQCHGLLYIISGQIRVYMTSDEGKEITLFRLLPGDVCVLSASCIIHNLNFDVLIQFEAKTEVVQIRADVIEALKQQNSAVENYLLELVSGSFSEVMWVMEKVVFTPMTTRLCEYLIERSALEESNTLHITHADIANDLGSAREVVSRLLKYLQNEGAIIQSRGVIELQDLKLLSRF